MYWHIVFVVERLTLKKLHMKKIFTFLFICYSLSVFSQMPYVLDTRMETFTFLSGPNIMTGSIYDMNLPFTFVMSGPGLDTADVYTSGDGYIKMGPEGIVSMIGQMEIRDSSTQTSWQVEGVAPSRILKIEWKNHGFSNSPAGDDYINYQVWLYETSNVIEWHFGANYWYSGTWPTSPLVIIVYGSTTYTISGNPNSPVLLNCGPSCHLNGLPPSGKVYRLIPSAIAGMAEPNNNDISIYPNPSNGKFFIGSEKKISSIEVYNMLGERIIFSEEEDGTEIDLSGAAKGIYLIWLLIDGKILQRKIVVE
jgi:hypothetical protein